jgi:ERCC4-type nuclease
MAMTIIIDSREQKPLVFGCDWIRKKLHVGDYGAKFSENHLHNVVWERKGIGDLFGTLTFGYDRFRREIARAEQAKFSLIIAVECTKERVLEGYKHSARDPQSIIKQLETIEKKYGVRTMFFTNRTQMAHYIHDFYLVEYEKHLETIASLPENI